MSNQGDSTKCTYRKPYIDVDKNRDTEFVCQNDALAPGLLCKFHDPTYLNNDTADEVEREFRKRFEAALPAEDPLVFIGYYLPTLSLKSEKISRTIYFNDAKFNGKLDFSDTEFSNHASFLKCEFHDDVNFNGVRFYASANFSDIIIIGKLATFESIQFKNKLEFSRATINDILFRLCTFSEADFSLTRFQGNADFWNSDFTDDANFNRSIFDGSVDFTLCSFSKRGIFTGITFSKPTKMRQLRFTTPNDIIFDGNLTNVSFLDTNITTVRFGSVVIWNDLKFDLTKDLKGVVNIFRRAKSRNDKFKIYDERILEENLEPDLRLESVRDIYRDLIDNYESRSRYDISGEFYVREMELKRKFKEFRRNNRIETRMQKVFWRRASILAAYHTLAQYGQSYYRPFYVAMPILVSSFFYFWTVGFTTVEVISLENINSEDFNNALIRSISAFFPFYAFGTHNALSDLILRVVLLPISVTFFLALKRRLERKIRH